MCECRVYFLIKKILFKFFPPKSISCIRCKFRLLCGSVCIQSSFYKRCMCLWDCIFLLLYAHKMYKFQHKKLSLIKTSRIFFLIILKILNEIQNYEKKTEYSQFVLSLFHDYERRQKALSDRCLCNDFQRVLRLY